MDCDSTCINLGEENTEPYCIKFNRFLGDPPQMTSDCEAEYTENQKINKRDDDREDIRLFRSIDNG